MNAEPEVETLYGGRMHPVLGGYIGCGQSWLEPDGRVAVHLAVETESGEEKSLDLHEGDTFTMDTTEWEVTEIVHRVDKPRVTITQRA
jgi:hypothetical protein